MIHAACYPASQDIPRTEFHSETKEMANEAEKKSRSSCSEKLDRLSDLLDCIIHKILSLKGAQTDVYCLKDRLL
jgi:hypothetical protein